jgi:hypothetical protein
MKAKAPLAEKKQPSRSQIQTSTTVQMQKNCQPKTTFQPTAKENKVQAPIFFPENKNIKNTFNAAKQTTFAVTSTQELPVKMAKQIKTRPNLAQGVTQELFPCK